MNPKYQLDSSENKQFLQDILNNLLSFGHQFPSEAGSSYYLGDDGTGKNAIGKPGSPVVWPTYIPSAHS